jgi:membrane protein
MVIKGHSIGPLLKRTAKEVMDDNVLGLAAQNAYYFFFSLFPIFLFLAPLISIVGDKQKVFDFLLGQLAQVVPADAFALIADVVKNVVLVDNAPGLVSVGALLALWAGSNIFSGLIDALNAAYDVSDSRPWWKKKLIAIACLLGVGGMFALATIVMLGGEDVVAWMADLLRLGETGRWIWTVIQFPIAFAILVFTACIVYRFLPNVRQNKWHILVGAMFTTIVWLIVTMAFRYYVQNFGNYNATYGTIGGVIALMTWMYLSMIVLLIGGELAAELMHGTGAMQPRSGTLFGGRVSTGASPRATSTERVDRIEPLASGGA